LLQLAVVAGGLHCGGGTSHSKHLNIVRILLIRGYLSNWPVATALLLRQIEVEVINSWLEGCNDWLMTGRGRVGIPGEHSGIERSSFEAGLRSKD
jgi:hypothetical protein